MTGYVAGVLEGEGSFMTTTGGHAPRVQIHMTDLDVLETVQRVLGCGTISPVTKRQEHWKDAWTWRCSGNDAARVMDIVYPYMGKRRQEKIDEVRKVWYDRLDAVNARKAKALAAAREYLEGNTSLRQVAEKHGVSYETVRRTAWKID